MRRSFISSILKKAVYTLSLVSLYTSTWAVRPSTTPMTPPEELQPYLGSWIKHSKNGVAPEPFCSGSLIKTSNGLWVATTIYCASHGMDISFYTHEKPTAQLIKGDTGSMILPLALAPTLALIRFQTLDNQNYSIDPTPTLNFIVTEISPPETRIALDHFDGVAFIPVRPIDGNLPTGNALVTLPLGVHLGRNFVLAEEPKKRGWENRLDSFRWGVQTQWSQFLPLSGDELNKIPPEILQEHYSSQFEAMGSPITDHPIYTKQNLKGDAGGPILEPVKEPEGGTHWELRCVFMRALYEGHRAMSATEELRGLTCGRLYPNTN